MALIPNESYSFPDDVSMGVIRPRKTKQPRAQSPQIKIQRRPGLVATKKTLPPLPPLPAPLALARSRAPQRTVVKNAAPPDQKREGKDRPKEVVTVRPALLPVEEVQIDLFESDIELHSKRSRRSRWIGFAVLEIIALAVVIPSAWFTLERVHTDPSMVVLLNILTISSAAAVAIIPIIFFAIAPALSRH